MRFSAENPAGVSAASEVESENRETVKMLYRALRHGDTEKVTKLVGTDLDWWCRGLPHFQYMLKVLTGESTPSVFKFRPRRIRAGGERVIVEGWEGIGVYWVHVWGLKHGIITEFREHFNTSLTVVLRVSEDGDEARLWQSTPRVRVKGSLLKFLLC